MLSVDAVIDRLKLLSPTVLRSVDGTADMQAMIQAKRLPQITPAAHVVPAGLQGGRRDDTAGGYVQPLTETVGVVVTLRGNDVQGKAAMGRIDPIIAAIIAQIAGWSPADDFDQFEFARGAVLSLDAEGLVYLLEFTRPTQLRTDQ